MVDWFEPGFRAGGPIRSCVNIAKSLKNDVDVFVFTSDRDIDMSMPYPGIVTDSWIQIEKELNVYYASPASLTWKNIKTVLLDVKADFIYLNSMFSKYFSLYPLLMKKWLKLSQTLILAPRGMLKPSALRFKKAKKKTFLLFFTAFGLHKLVKFHATEKDEYSDIQKIFGKKIPVELIDDFPGEQDTLSFPEKVKGVLRIIFIGRIHPIKNLDYILSVLNSVKSSVHLTIVGTMEDQQYWEHCNRLITQMNGKKVEYVGDFPHEQIKKMILDHHLLCLPTKGENFGHAIFEALASGRPVLISDQTPWRNLATNKAGWDLSLANPGKFTEIFELCASMSAEEFNKWCSGAWNFCNRYIQSANIKQQYLKLFS